jgi:hypothetical protein
MNKNILKNGGFPPIKYCETLNTNTQNETPKKERFFSNVQKQNINIRELLSQNIKQPVIIVDVKDDSLEEVSSL